MGAVGLAVLHPRKLVVYEVVPNGGKSGGQVSYYTLEKQFEHELGLDGEKKLIHVLFVCLFI